MRRNKRLVVSLPGREIGELTQNRQGLVRWTPDIVWEREGQQPRLGLDFLRKLGARWHASDLPSWFENLLPERESRLRTRLCSAHGLRDGQSFDLLQVLGHDLIGAVECRVTGQSYESAYVTANEPGEAPEIATSEEPHRWSALTGMQLKFSMSMVNARLVLSARGRDGIWIVKIAGAEYDELAEVETATMTWAKLTGFDVPQHFTVPFDHLDGIPPGWTESVAPAFAIRRFDRRDDGSKIHQEDLCQALDLRPGNKYGERPRVSFEGALRLVHDACGESEGREMARRIGFMIASGNTDAHLKNWGLLWGERTRPTLAPCYDLVTTIAWERLGWQRHGGPTLALRLGGETFFRLLNEHTLDTCSKNSGCSWARREIIEGIERSRDTWSHISGTAPMRMCKALEEHWAAVPLLAAMGPLPKSGG